SRFAELNSEENLRKKFNSGFHRFVVAKESSSGRPVGFAIFRILNDKCILGTRLHVSREFRSIWLSKKIHQFVLELMRKEGYELLYAEGSGKARVMFCKSGFLYIDSFVNKAIKNARIDRVVTDMHAGAGNAIEESAFVRHLSEPEWYSVFLKQYGLLLERLFGKIERMHKTGSSGVKQSVFSHVENGLLLIQDLNKNLSKNFVEPVKWQDVEMMWVFHDIGEIGMDSDIPSYKKSRADSLNEKQKGNRILNSIQNGELRTKLVDLYERYELRKLRKSNLSRTGIDKEAAICAFADKLEAAVFIGTSGIGKVWKKKTGSWMFQRMLRKHALGAFLKPAKEMSLWMDEDGRKYLYEKLTGIVMTYYENGLISKSFFENRMDAITLATLGSDR
ncbi:MAG TPA: GNAT family N-acetyltransferase, partial [Bacteroidia bacterium]|nr:GNAT family N-acetyltransferase [Bacteroidia bacterium]